MSKATIKKMFPGAVTSQGFFSYYNHIIQSDAEHIFVIKGGPGVGKSTFMKKIGESMLERGYDIEYHCCSSDNGSIDGIVIPKLGVALMDGTAPHIVDPKNPGAVDEIINLGEYWNEEMLKHSKQDILRSNYQVSRYFQAAYLALKEAKIAIDEWEFYISEYQDWGLIDQMMLKVEKELFKIVPKGHGKQRHMFAWAHSPQGKVQYIDSLLKDTNILYMLQGQPGTGKASFLAKIAERALSYGLYVEHFHNTLEPQKLDLLIIPEISTALVIDAEPYPYSPDFKGKIITLNFEQSLNHKALESLISEIQDSRQRVNQHLARALANSKKAKQTHDLMETYYIPAMDFAAIEKKYFNILERILILIEQSIAVSTEKSKEI